MSARRFNEADVVGEFADALAAAGFRLRGAPRMDGLWHRAAVDGDKGAEKSGRYRGYINGIRPAGFVENFRDATRTGLWKAGTPLPVLSAVERESVQREIAAASAAREQRDAARLDSIARNSVAIWEAAPPAPGDHPYLLRKGIPGDGLRIDRDGRLLVPMHDFAGHLRSLQTIAGDGTKRFPEGGRVIGLHMLLGELAPSTTLLIAEGYATGATLHQATGHAVAVAFSKTNYTGIARTYGERFPGLRIAFAGDNDHHHPRRDPPLPNVGRDAAEAAAQDAGGVAILPDFDLDQTGTDWNDYAGLHGLEAVRDAIEAGLPPPPPLPLLPFHPLPTGTAAEARAAVAVHVRGFLTRVQAFHAAPEDVRSLPEHAGLAVEVAAGKTTITCGELPGFIAEAKAAGRPHRVLFLVPTHKLGGEVNARLASLGLHVATWRGREAEDPEAGLAMCHDLPATRDAIAAYQDVESSVCGKPGGTRCPFAGSCSYQLQKAAAAAADVVVAAHEAMLGALPAGIGDGFAVVIADEGWLQDGAETRVLAAETLQAGETDHPIMFEGDPTRRDDEATFDLHFLRRQLAGALEGLPDGYLTRAALVAAELTSADCTKANKLEWRRKVSGAMHPGMTAAARQEAVGRCAGNAAIPRLSALWKAVDELLDGDDEATGRVELGRRDSAEGSQRVILLHTLKPVAERVLALPLLLLDATLPAALLRHRLPHLAVLAEVRAAAPHMRVHQILGGFGKTSIIPDPNPQKRENPGKREKENQRRLNRIAEVRDFILLRTGGARALVITYKELEPYFADLPGVETAHFGAVEGLDQWGPQPDRPGIRYLFQIGRPMAKPEDTRRQAAALTGRPVPKETPGFVTRGTTMRDGSAMPVDVRAYVDPDLEAVRASITDAATVQNIGRGRGLNRTAANPLDVWLLAGDLVAPLPLDSLTRWDDAAPGPSARMAARGVVLESGSDAARAYPDLFPTAEAAKKALQREKGGADHRDIPLWMTPIGVCPDDRAAWVRVEYRPAGHGPRTRIAWVRPDRLPDLRAWLEAATGAEMVHYAPQPAPAPPPRPAAVPEAPPTPAATAATPSPAVRLAALTARLHATRPPALEGDDTDLPRLQAWRQRCSKRPRISGQRVAA
jgi:putative DNA primase/helicase